MDEAVNHLVSFGALMLGVVSFIGTFLLRRIVETAAPGLRKMSDANAPGLTYGSTAARWWNEVILYALPAIVGAMVGLANAAYIFADMKIDTLGGRVLCGVVMGFFSGFVYKVLAKGVRRVTGVELVPERGGSLPPSDPPGATA